MKTYTIEFTEQEIDLILTGLGELKFVLSHPIVNKILKNVEEQKK